MLHVLKFSEKCDMVYGLTNNFIGAQLCFVVVIDGILGFRLNIRMESCDGRLMVSG